MISTKAIVLTAMLMAGCYQTTLAQTNIVTITNVVTVLVTNIVTVTNSVTAAPAVPVVPVPTVQLPPAPEKIPWASSISAGLTLTRGNKSSTMVTADYVTKKKTPVNEYALGAGVAYGEQNSEETVNNYRAFAQWNHLFTERFYGYLRTDGLHDSIADLDYRINVGPGLGYYFIKSSSTSLSAEIGGGFEAQRLGGEDETFATTRAAEQFEHKFNDRARVWQSLDFVPQVDDWNNYLVNFEIGLESSLSKAFSLKTYLLDTYANRPALSRQKNDAKIVAALSYKF